MANPCHALQALRGLIVKNGQPIENARGLDNGAPDYDWKPEAARIHPQSGSLM